MNETSRLTRQTWATVVNRLQKVCEWSNIKLSAAATDITGTSARAMLEAILAGQTTPQTLADLAKGRLRNKRPELELALHDIVRDHHRFLLAQHLAQIDFLDEQITLFDTQIVRHMATATPDDAPEPPALAGPPIDTVAPTPTDVPAAAPAPLTGEEAVNLLDTIPGVNLRTALVIADLQRRLCAAYSGIYEKVTQGTTQISVRRV